MSVPSHDVVAVPLKIGGIFHKHSHDEWPLLLPRSSLIQVVSKCFWQINCVHSQDHCPSAIYQLFACVPPNIPMLSENLQSMDHFSARNLQSKHLRVPCCCVCWTSCDAVCVVGRIQSGNGLLGHDVGVSERWVLIPQPGFFFPP